jgi:hypothetical protein
VDVLRSEPVGIELFATLEKGEDDPQHLSGNDAEGSRVMDASAPVGQVERPERLVGEGACQRPSGTVEE